MVMLQSDLLRFKRAALGGKRTEDAEQTLNVSFAASMSSFSGIAFGTAQYAYLMDAGYVWAMETATFATRSTSARFSCKKLLVLTS